MESAINNHLIVHRKITGQSIKEDLLTQRILKKILDTYEIKNEGQSI
jgi:hypothetical protein